jgi:hypothetical protein
MPMSSEPAPGGKLTLFARARAILTRPREAWAQIARDGTPSGELFTAYAAPLAAIGPLCFFLASRFSNGPFSGGLMSGLYRTVASYGVSLAGLLIMSFIAARLAKHFNGDGSPRDAFKLIAYSSTAAWLAGAFVLAPPLSFLSMLGLYSFYLFYQGIGPIMKVPEDKRTPFAVVTIGSAILLGMASNLLVASPTWNWTGANGTGWDDKPRIEVRHDDKDGFGPREMRALIGEIRDAVRQGKVKAVAPADLEALLPADIGSFHRTRSTSETHGPGGSEAEARYEQGDRDYELRIVDLGSFGQVAQLGLTFDIDHNRDEADGYEHLSVKDGKPIVEKWAADDREGTYATMIRKRFLIAAKGEVESIDQLKTAVSSISPARLAALEQKVAPQKALPAPE